MATNALNVKDPLLDEDEIIKAAQPESYEVQTRAFLDNVGADYGLSSSDLGWLKKDGVGNILINGNPFTTADRVKDGISYIDKDKATADFDKYVKTYSLKSTKDIEQETLDKFNIGNFGYNDPYEDTMKGLLEQILNPTPFSYDSASDPSFKSYEQKYNRQGDRALANTMSEATGITGGRLNSWAVSAGQQAKENFDQKLMDVIPQLENVAYNRYQDGIDNKRSNFNTLLDVDNEAFRRASDARNFAYDSSMNIAENKRLADNTKYERATAKEQTTYDRGRDAKADENYKTEWEHTVEQDKFNNNLDTEKFVWDKSQDAQANARAWANYSLSKQQFEWNKETDARDFDYKKTRDEINDAAEAADVDSYDLGVLFQAMMTSENPQAWLINSADGLTDKLLNGLQDLLPKDDDADGNSWQELIDAIREGKTK